MIRFKIAIILFIILTAQLAFTQSDFTSKMEEEEAIGVWNIKKGILIDTKNKHNQLARDNWKIFYGLFPKRVIQKYIKQIVLFTDGIDEKTGALAALNESNNDWQLMLDISDVNFQSKDKERVRQSVYTLVHEFGHLITLNNTQIRPTLKTTQKEGEPYVTYEGQALRDSYINKFVELFWDGSLLKEWDFIRKKYCYVEQESCLEQLYGLYEENYTDFLTDYAAESPEEDIVESWTAFVLGERIRNPKMKAHKKINFFYDYPELIKYRQIIRKNIKRYKYQNNNN